MPQISLAKALKLKNRLAGRLAKVTSDIKTYNSVLIEQAGKVNVVLLVTQRNDLVNALKEVKVAIYKANVPIIDKIFDLGEYKANVEFVNSLSTTQGKVKDVYGQTEVEYSCTLDKSSVDLTRAANEKAIDAAQDALDTFNYSTKIEIKQSTLDLAS